MEIFWNKPDTDKINGLDVIGLRRIDQGVEKEWVAGITTISIRAKYVSMLAWGLVEAYKIMPEKDGAKEFDEKILNDVFSRIEFLVLASSKWSAKKREAKDDGGLLGADTHKKEITELLEKGEVVVPSGKVVGLIGTYYVTSSIFGFVFHDPNSALPISITPRGKQLWETIDESLQGSGLKELVLKGGSLSTDVLDKEGYIFAANEIQNNPKEKKLLEVAFLSPANESEELKLIYSNLIQTLTLLKTEGAKEKDAEKIILSNYLKIDPDSKNNEVFQLAWAEYEARRRVHFALELFLNRSTKTLNDIGPNTISTVIDQWIKRFDDAKKHNDLFDFCDPKLAISVGTFVEKFKAKAIVIEEYLPFRNYENDISSVLSSFALIIDTYNRVSPFLESGTMKSRGTIFETVFKMIEESSNKSVSEFLIELIRDAVFIPHISNTLRKMANGAKCSLRAYNDGDILFPTGICPGPGRSGTRLYNVINMFADIGCIERSDTSLEVKAIS